MNISRIPKGLTVSKASAGIILALASSLGHAAVDSAKLTAPAKIYAGVFGGFASPNSYDVSQYGTAYITEANGGPLAVNALGSVDGNTEGLIGARVGFQWAEITWGSDYGLVPAFEIEGFYIGKNSFNGHLINNTSRIPEHDFDTTFPTKTGVFLTNAVISLNSPRLGRVHPYLGFGIGGAITKITNATSIQVSPAEPGLNHFNSNTSDKDSTFATQAKLGLNVDLTKNISMFVEYRWLYLASTEYVFGSTIYPGHSATTNWQVKMDPQNYNMGTIGIQFSA